MLVIQFLTIFTTFFLSFQGDNGYIIKATCMFLNSFCRGSLKSTKLLKQMWLLPKKEEVYRKTKYTHNIRLSDVRMLEWMHCGSHTCEILYFTFWGHVIHKAPSQ